MTLMWLKKACISIKSITNGAWTSQWLAMLQTHCQLWQLVQILSFVCLLWSYGTVAWLVAERLHALKMTAAVVAKSRHPNVNGTSVRLSVRPLPSVFLSVDPPP